MNSMKSVCFLLVCLLFAWTADAAKAGVFSPGPCAPATTSCAPPVFIPAQPIPQLPACGPALPGPGACDSVRDATLCTVRERIHPLATIAAATVERLSDVRQNVHARADARIEHRVQSRHTIHTRQCSTDTVTACSPVTTCAPPTYVPIPAMPAPPVCGPARCND